MATENVGDVKLLRVRLSFFAGFEKDKDKINSKTKEVIKGKYKANGLMEKGTEDTKANMAKLKAVNEAVKLAKWGPPEKQPKLKPEKVYLRDGNLENWDGYDGCYYVSANSDDQPVLIDRVKDEKGKWVVLTKENGGPKKLYSGAIVNMIIRVWAQDNEHGRRMNAEIKCIQFVAHGTPFSQTAPVDPDDAFDDDDVGPDDLDQIDDGSLEEDVGDLV